MTSICRQSKHVGLRIDSARLELRQDLHDGAHHGHESASTATIRRLSRTDKRARFIQRQGCDTFIKLFVDRITALWRPKKILLHIRQIKRPDNGAALFQIVSDRANRLRSAKVS